MKADRKKTVSLYRITNLVNGKKYIGITRNSVEERWRSHNTNHALTNNSGRLQRAIIKYGKESFSVEHVCEIFKEEDASSLERFFIKEEGTLSPGGYNMTSGGELTPGYSKSEETKRKLSKSLKGRDMTDNMRKALLASHLGKPMRDDVKEKIRASLKGRPSPLKDRSLSDEHKAKVGAFFKGRKSPLLGRKASAEARENMRISQTGRKHSEETLKKMRGQKRTPETKRKIKEALTGRTFSAEHKKNLSAAQKRIFNANSK